MISRTIITRDEPNPRGFKTAKERVTIMVAGNCSGNHTLPLMAIGKFAKPRCFQKQIPNNYYHSRSAWMTAELFVQWWDEVFIPEVEDYHRKRGRVSNVIVLLDNAPVHPNPESLERSAGRFRVRYFPANVTPLIQPMDHTVIAALKTNYRRMILADLIRLDDEGEVTRQLFLKTYSLKDAMKNINTA